MIFGQVPPYRGAGVATTIKSPKDIATLWSVGYNGEFLGGSKIQ
jgi:hypothetical protein